MNRLLAANFARVKKEKLFWFELAAMFLFGIFASLKNVIDQTKVDWEIPVDNFFFAYVIIILFLSAAFCSLFIGTEYSDGAIRNKLVVGHLRRNIYLSNFLTVFTAGLLLCLAYALAVCAAAMPFLGTFQADIRLVLILCLSSILMVAAISALFTMIGMLSQNKAMTVVICLLGVVVLFSVAIYLNTRLEAPEFYTNYVMTDAAGHVVPGDKMPNPDYLKGMSRAVFQFFLDFLPTGQAIQISNLSAPNLWLLPLYSLVISLAATFGGMFFFRKRDIK